MAPKKTKAADDGGELNGEMERARCDELLSSAFANGMLTRSMRPNVTSLSAGKVLAKADGHDVVKKSTTRKNRYLLVFCAQIAPRPGGVLGELTQMHTQTPVVYVDFPQGRMKFFGAFTFPKNKYMVLKFGARDHVLCEDVFGHAIVFSEAIWIGTPEANPDELALPMPSELQQPPADAKAAGGADFGAGLAATAAPASAKPAAKRASRAAAESDEESAGSGDDSDADADEPAARRERPKRRSASAPRTQDGAPSPDEVSDEEAVTQQPDSAPPGDVAPATKPAKQVQARLSAFFPAGAAKRGGGAAEEASQPAKRPSAGRAASGGSGAVPARARKRPAPRDEAEDDDDDEDDDEDDGDDDDDDDDDFSELELRPAAKRSKASATPAKAAADSTKAPGGRSSRSSLPSSGGKAAAGQRRAATPRRAAAAAAERAVVVLDIDDDDEDGVGAGGMEPVTPRERPSRANCRGAPAAAGTSTRPAARKRRAVLDSDDDDADDAAEASGSDKDASDYDQDDDSDY